MNVRSADAFSQYLHLPETFARRFTISGSDHDDVVQECRIALWEAARNYDPSRGVPFEAFAHDVMRRRVADAITKASRLKHSPLTTAIRGSVNEAGERLDVLDLVSSRVLGTEELVMQLEDLRELIRAIIGLNDLERAAIIRAINGVGQQTKRDDNALQRARTKLKRARAAA